MKFKFKRKKMVFAGYYGKNNIGDDVFCNIAAWGCQYYWGIEQALFLSKTIPIINENCKSLLSKRRYIKGQRAIESVVQLFLTEWLVFAGGSLFQDVPSNFSPKCLARFAKKYSKLNIGAIGVSIGPFASKKAENFNKELLNQFSFLVVRDRRSFDVAKSMDLSCNVVEGRDLAFLMTKKNNKYNFCHVGRKLILGVTLCRYESFVNGNIENEKRRIEFLVDSILLLAEEVDVIVRLFVFNNHYIYGEKDLTEGIYTHLKSKCKIEIIPYSKDVGKIYQKLAECSAMLSTRLHGAILAASLRVPFLLVEYHEKCSDFLDDVGWPTEYRIGDCQCSVTDVSNMLATILNADKEFVIPLFKDLFKVEELAEKNFRGVASFFDTTKS